MTDAPFSSESINAAVDQAIAKDGNTFDVGVDAAPGERPSFTIEAQGEHERLTWAAWAKTKFTKATTAIGAKMGFRW